LQWLNEKDEQDSFSSDLLSSDNFDLELENVDGDLFATFFRSEHYRPDSPA
jgi:hypothetical protein